MLKKVVYVALLVSDQDRALDFYTNVIGLEKRGDYPHRTSPRFLTVGVKGQDFELVLWPGTPARGEAGSPVYTIEVEDIRTAFETLKSRGVKFEPPEILEFPWGYAGRFQDPDGNLLSCERVKGSFASEAAEIVTLFRLMFSAGAPLAVGLGRQGVASLCRPAALTPSQRCASLGTSSA